MTNQSSALDSFGPYTGNGSVIVGNRMFYLFRILALLLYLKILLYWMYWLFFTSLKIWLSISKLTSDYLVDIVFSDKSFMIKTRVTKKVLAQGRCDNGLYVLERGHSALLQLFEPRH